MTTNESTLTSWQYQHKPRFEAIQTHVDAATKHVDTPRILDVGGDPYHHLRYFDQDMDITTINYGDGEPYTITRYGYDIDVVECNADEDRWPLEDDEFDCVLMGAILEHLFNPLHAVGETRRVGHSLVLSTPNAVRLIQRIRVLLGRNVFDGFGGMVYDRHQHEYTMPELVDLLLHAGWMVDAESTVSLNRPQAGRVVQALTKINPRWRDQLLVRCERTPPTKGNPGIYRQSLTDREGAGGD